MFDEYNYNKKEVMLRNAKKILNPFKKNEMLSFEGRFRTWDEVKRKCTGYDSETIIEKEKIAALKVKNGEACYERDTYLFHKKNYNFPILASLLKQFLLDGYLSVLDFGGSLGSMYFQHKDVFDVLEDKLCWTIVEQQKLVEFGKEKLEDQNLFFKYRIDDVTDSNCILFGSSLQYIDNPQEIIEKAVLLNPAIIIVDKTPMCDESWFSIERVHEPIYEASYPIHIMKQDDLVKMFNNRGFILEYEWIPEAREEFSIKNKHCVFKSMLFKRIEN